MILCLAIIPGILPKKSTEVSDFNVRAANLELLFRIWMNGFFQTACDIPQDENFVYI